MSRSSRLFTPLAAIVVIAAAAPVAGAQDRASDSVAVSPNVAANGAASTTTALSSIAPTPAAATRLSSAPGDAPVAALRAARAQEVGRAVAVAGSQHDGKVYMIVGGAALITGALIGDDVGTIIMLGGAGIGLYGLYLYVR